MDGLSAPCAALRPKEALMLNPPFYHRVARWLNLRHVPLLPQFLVRFCGIFHRYTPGTVEIGDGFAVGYGGLGIVVHPRVKIGRNVFVSNGVTIGGRKEQTGVPRVEDLVFIATEATVLSDTTMGRDRSSAQVSSSSATCLRGRSQPARRRGSAEKISMSTTTQVGPSDR
jgi:serine O-acetyltransferase